MPKPLRAGGDRQAVEFGVFAIDVRPPMMGEVKIPECAKRQHKDDPADMPHHVVQPFVREWGLVGAFMGQREQKADQDALDRQQHPPQRDAGRDQGRAQDNQPAMDRKVAQGRAIAACRERCAGFLIYVCQKRFVVCGFVHSGKVQV